MSSIDKVNNVGKVQFATFQANEAKVTPRAYLNDYEYDSFNPSFKGGAAASRGFASKAGRFMRRTLLAVILGSMVATTTQSCKKDRYPVIQIVNVNENNDETNALLEQILAEIQAGNALNQTIIDMLIQQGVDVQELIALLHQNHQSLENLVTSNEEIKQVLIRIEALVTTIQTQQITLGQEQNALLSQIFTVLMNLNANNNANQEQIIALLNQLLDQLTQMSNQNAGYYAGILNAINHMNQQLQAQLLEILGAINGLDENMQAGYLAILAQLQGLEASLQASLMEILSHIDQLSAQVQAKLNQLIALASQMNQNMLACTAQIMAQLQNMQDEQAQQALDILLAMQNMGGDLQQHYIDLMNLIQNLGATQQAQLLAILNQMIHMEDEQEQQYLSILEALQNQSGESLAPILLQILAQMQNMEEAQEQQYLNVMAQLQNMAQAYHADFLALMAKLTNMQGGQEAILNAMQALNADFLAMFAQTLSHLEVIEQNQATQIAQLAEVLAKIQNGNATLDEIKDLIANISIDPQVDLSAIESLLQQILASQNTTNNLLQDQTAALGLIHTTSQALYQAMQEVIQNQEDYNINFEYYQNIQNDWLENIFNAIQDLNCDECCEQLINILIEIDQHIQDLDWNHEGIDDDLDPLLG